MSSRGAEPGRGPLSAVGEEEQRPERISVAVAERPELLLEALVMALTHAGLHIAGACGDLDRLLEILQRRRPQIALVDAALEEGLDPIAATARLRAASPRTRVVVLARDLTPVVSRAALAQEVDGLVTGALSPRQLAETLRHVAAGQSVFPAGWIADAHRADERSLQGLLSPRQLEVLELLAAGLTNREIAARLHLSANTVKFHVRTIYERTGVTNRVQAARVLSAGTTPSGRVGPPHPGGSGRTA